MDVMQTCVCVCGFKHTKLLRELKREHWRKVVRLKVGVCVMFQLQF